MSATIVSCKRLIEAGEASQTQNGENEKLQYLVEVSEWNATPLEVSRASWSPTAGNVALPAYFSPHALNSGIVVINKTAKRRKSDKGKDAKFHWVVTVEWGKVSGYTGPLGSTGNSQNISIKITTNEQCIYTQASLSTVNNAPNTPSPIRNIIGDLYPDPVEESLYDTMIEVSYETDSLNNALWDAGIGKICNAVVTMSLPQGSKTYTRTFAKHTLLLKSANRSVVFSRTDPSQQKWQNDVVLLWREDTWDRKLPQKGYRYRLHVDDGSEDGTEELTDWKDHPEYLDNDGHKLASGVQLVTTDPQQMKKETDLGTLLATI